MIATTQQIIGEVGDQRQTWLIQLAQVGIDKLELHGQVADWFHNLNMNAAGFVIVGMFVGTSGRSLWPSGASPRSKRSGPSGWSSPTRARPQQRKPDRRLA